MLLGEAKAGNFEDLVAIASAIANRAAATNTTASNIVAKRSEFNAYGKSLPAGVEKYRDLAKEAIDYVNTFGPTHTGQFYATPAAKDNLPSGLRQVSASPGHVFFEDPQGRSINTAVGYRQPGPVEIASAAPDIGPVLDYRPDYLAYSEPEEVAYSEPVSGYGLAGISPSFVNQIESAGSRGTLSSFDRSGLSPSAQAMVDAMVNLGLGDVGVNSGFRSPSANAAAGGASRSQHMGGNAIDLATKSLSVPDRERVLDAALSAGAKGIGLYDTGSTHFDTRSSPAFWGPQGYTNPGRTMAEKISNMPEWSQPNLTALANADGYSYLPSGSNFNVPTPSARPEAPKSVSPSLDLMTFDPAKNPELAYATPSAPVAAYADPQKTATPFDAVLDLPEVPTAPSVPAYTDAKVSAPNAGKAPSAPIDKVTEIAAKAPEVPDLADQYASYGAGRQLKEQAANLALDVAQTKGIAPNFMPTAPAIATQPTAPKAPSITDVQPKAPDLPAARNVSNAPQVKTVDSQFSKQPEAPDMATNRAQLAAIAANNMLADAKKDQRAVATIAGTLGGIALGPIGGILGTIIGNQLGKNSYLQQFPEAPAPSTFRDFFSQMTGGAFGSGGVSYNDLNDFGRQAYNDSQNFRDSIDSGGVGLY
ncbi:hypothetical protein ASD54_12220 [Rhizobium sp. Root149]|nr:hypothetical protein ASD54_12220 [Rhizobium sp. Root149]